MRNLKLLLAGTVLFASAGLASAGTVYIGTDPSVHYGAHPDGLTLVGNAVRWAGGAADPTIAYSTNNDGFGGSAGAALTAAGFSSATAFTSASLAAADLSPYRVLYIQSSTSVADYVAASANIAAFVAAGGGLVVEAQVFDAASWSWVPDAALIGHSGASNVGGEDTTIVAGGHPVMAGLTDAGLSNWGFSVHSTFSTPGAAGYVTLATALRGPAYIIAKDGVAVPLPTSSLMGLGLLAGLGAIAFKRRRTQSL